jgi:hypothetical protein
VLLAGGGAGFAFGVGFAWKAVATRDEAAAAPAETSQDLRRLDMLEQRAQRFTIAGAALSIAGGTLVGIGIVRGWRERKTTATTSLSLVPTQDGAALVYAGSLP